VSEISVSEKNTQISWLDTVTQKLILIEVRFLYFMSWVIFFVFFLQTEGI